VLTNAGAVYYEAGHFDRAQASYDHALTLIQEAGALHIWVSTATNKHALLVDRGLFDDARALQDEIIAVSVEEDAARYLATLEGNVALMHYYLGDLKRTKQYVDASLRHADRFGMHHHRLSSRALLGLIALEEARLSEANDHAKWIGEQSGRDRMRTGDFSFIEIFLARWNTRLGRKQQAISDLEMAIDDCRERDFAAGLRMRLELASLLRKDAPLRAKQIALDVKERARLFGIHPVKEAASSVLLRLP
jgi:tetratricopeptide (TPR) repeat protein